MVDANGDVSTVLDTRESLDYPTAVAFGGAGTVYVLNGSSSTEPRTWWRSPSDLHQLRVPGVYGGETPGTRTFTRPSVGRLGRETAGGRRCHTEDVTGDGRLNALEAGFLWMETDVQPLHVGSLLIFEGPSPDHAEFRDRIAARLAPSPWHRRRVQRMPLDLGRPIWVDSEHFAVEEHLHHAVLDPPGDEAQVRAMVLWIMAERLDSSRPMWELWQVDGLAGGRWAVIAKAHHAMVDGRSGSDVVQTVLDPEQEALSSVRRRARGQPTPPRPVLGAPWPRRVRRGWWRCHSA